MTVIILGAAGQLGRDLCEIIPETICLSHTSSGVQKTVDVTSTDDIQAAMRLYTPKVIINASALTDVDRCETERKLALEINGKALKYITRAAREIDAYLVHISTDYVFDGNKGYYDEDSVPNPINYYGLSKLVGDVYANSYENSLIVRTSGVFGHSANFPRYAFNSLSRGKVLNVIEGYYSPIHAHYLAGTINELLRLRPSGILNVAGDRTSRLNLAKKICEIFDFNPGLIKSSAESLKFKAVRPFDSSLNIEKAKSMISFDFHSLEKNLRLLESS